MVVVIQVARRSFAGGRTFQFRAIHYKNVRPTVIVIIEYRHARTCGFNNVFFCVFATEYHRGREPSLCGHVGKMCNRCGSLAVGILGVLGCRSARVHGEPGKKRH